MPSVLQNVILPLDRDPDLLPLYIDAETWSIIDEDPVRVSDRAHVGNVLDRTTLRIPGGERVSFGTYFNAFPASYWQHWTPVRRVRLTVRLSGGATVLVYRSNGGGTPQRMESAHLPGEADEGGELSFDLEVTRFSDGGWMWFDVVADGDDVEVRGAEWTTDQEPRERGLASIGMTTYNKPDYCVQTLRSLADAPDVLELIDRVFVVDQGDQLVSDEPGYGEVAERLGDTLAILRQANLGGSGGFSRAMSESLERPDTAFVQLLDDDVIIEPESLRRSIMFGRFASRPLLVGGHMFDLLDRPKLHAWAEVVDERPFMWRNLFQERMPHHFGEANLRQSPMLHMRMDADYNGWWMCLIPTEVIRRVGLAMPAFIKWDDAEFCLRAREAGFPTVSLPGAALWHVSWLGKDDAIDWQAYFHARNRLVAALLHSNAPRGGTLLRHSRRIDLKHLMMMQYYPVALRMRALRDVLSGPQHMWPTLATAMPAARALAADFPETRIHKGTDSILQARHGRQVFRRLRRNTFDSPTGLRLRWFTLGTLIKHWFHVPRPENLETPEVEFGKGDANWWRLPRYDSALVSSADGSGKNVYVRDRAAYRRMLMDTLVLHWQLKRQWRRLASEYRRALPDLVSLESWRSYLQDPR
ncbi:glycosyltransferase family 2 protein [Microbacterium sp. dk485]|uniref:Glycosyltransferase family 2 protein n=1 Tax=Microbacterium wangchenii TaxID=2541726 RepID=A0ABX5SPP0_9MICO|nr:glycosyltransferase [Microbacterium sp. EYE_512]QBR88111.1 glycosyltransferase family 2 protein [Microbacterium wangchenii]TFV83769.1 glycosyltransferase family 2 protein [Microbacterium sp. dk485]TXK18099.1 glycosyltransferase family 2 protein [Microbacterium wangchenii]